MNQWHFWNLVDYTLLGEELEGTCKGRNPGCWVNISRIKTKHSIEMRFHKIHYNHKNWKDKYVFQNRDISVHSEIPCVTSDFSHFTHSEYRKRIEEYPDHAAMLIT